MLFGLFVACSVPGDYLLVSNDYFCIINWQNETVFAQNLYGGQQIMPVVELHRLKNGSDCPIWSSTSKLAIKVQGDKSELLDVNGRAHTLCIMSHNTNF